jgi:type I restriction enzyme, S subunit
MSKRADSDVGGIHSSEWINAPLPRLAGNRTVEPLSEWQRISMTALGSIQAGRQRTPRHMVGKMRPYLRVANVQDGWIDFRNVKSMAFTDKEAAIYELRPGDVLLAEGQSLELVGRPAAYRGEIEGCCFQNTLVRLRPHEHEPQFVFYTCQHLYFLGAFQKIAKKTTSIAHLGVSRFASLTVLAPPIAEQRGIANVLAVWDEALQGLDALLKVKEKRKRALMQRLLTGKDRVARSRGPWRVTNLGEVLEFTPRETPKPSGPFLSAGIRSHGRGVFLKHDFAPADIALDDLFQLRAGDLVLNITFAWEGAAAIVPQEADGALVSHRFPTFTIRNGKATASFFRHFILTDRFVFACGLASPGGAGRNRVLSKSAFLKTEVFLPPVEEQRQIGDILDAAAEEIRLLRGQRASLERQKRGLMEKLLTGKLRVPA